MKLVAVKSWKVAFAAICGIGISVAVILGVYYCDRFSVGIKHERIAGLPEKTVVLTIDDGPDPRFTPQLLSLLEKYNAHATFFIIGDHAVKYPDLVRAEVAAGHEIGNHTMTHPHLEEADILTVRSEISRSQQELLKITGEEPKWFRPPRGLLSRNAQEVLDISGLGQVYWTFCLEHRNSPTPQAMADRAFEKISQGSGTILLMHDGVLDRSRSVQALEILLEKLQQDNYRVVSLGEALAMPGTRLVSMR